MINDDVIRSVWRKRYYAALKLIDITDHKETLSPVVPELSPLVSALLFFSDILEELIVSGYNLHPPSVSILHDGSIELVFKKDLLKENKIPKLTVVFTQGSDDCVNIKYKSVYTEPLLKGTIVCKKDYKKEIQGLFNLCLLNLSI